MMLFSPILQALGVLLLALEVSSNFDGGRGPVVRNPDANAPRCPVPYNSPDHYIVDPDGKGPNARRKAYFLKGMDTANLISVDLYKKALHHGFEHLVIRGYEEGWGGASGGRISANFVQNYKNAIAAGYNTSKIDVIFFPCGVTAHPNCKKYHDQVDQLVRTIRENQFSIRRVWLEIDLDTDSGASNWVGSYAHNIKEANEIVDAIGAAYQDFGILSSPYAWQTIFGKRSAHLKHAPCTNNTPLWFKSWDMKSKTTENLKLNKDMRFGGWTYGIAKQYTNITVPVPGLENLVNLDIFVEVWDT
jgi:hypothetical protein